MRLRLDRGSGIPMHEQLREQIQAALHVGELRPGDRVPSLREMARRFHVNPKTVLRAYRTLRDQGLLEMRPGSGSVVGGNTLERPEEERARGLVRMARRHRSEASTLGLTPDDHRLLLARLAEDGGQRRGALDERVRLVVLECNTEQARVFAHEITHRLHVPAFPLLMTARGESAESILRMADLWVTTDFHFHDVRARATKQGRPCMTLRLDPRFPNTMLAAARRGTVLMIVSDVSIVPAFRRALANVGVPEEMRNRIRGVDGSDLGSVRQELIRAESVYVSPLCMDEVRSLVPRRILLSTPQSLIAASSIEGLRAMILTLRLGLNPALRPPPSTRTIHRNAGRDTYPVEGRSPTTTRSPAGASRPRSRR